MYFQPTKKNYYRFPSISSVQDLDSRYYFPEKSHASGEDTRYEDPYNRVIEREDFYDVY